MGDCAVQKEVLQVLLCLLYCGDSDSISGVVPSNLYDWVSDAHNEYQIWDYIHVCGHWDFFWSFFDEQFHVDRSD